MTATEARARIDTLLAEAHLAGQMNSAADREKFSRAWLEILRLVRDGADLSPTPTSETLQPLPVRPHVTPATLPEARERLAELRRRHDRLRASPQHLRSAADDAELDRLPADIRTLEREIQIAERAAA